MKPEILAAFIKVMGLSADTKAEDIKVEMFDKLQLAPETPVVAITAEETSKVGAFDKLKNIEVIAADKKEAFTGEVAAFSITPETHVIVAKEHFTKLETDKAALQQEKAALEGDAKLGKEYIGLQRAEAIRLCKAASGGKIEPAVQAMFEKATAEEITGLLKQHTKEATTKFSGKCGECGSKNFEFRSSFGKPDTDTVGTVEPVTNEDIYKEFAAPKMDIAGKK